MMVINNIKRKCVKVAVLLGFLPAVAYGKVADEKNRTAHISGVFNAVKGKGAGVLAYDMLLFGNKSEGSFYSVNPDSQAFDFSIKTGAGLQPVTIYFPDGKKETYVLEEGDNVVLHDTIVDNRHDYYYSGRGSDKLNKIHALTVKDRQIYEIVNKEGDLKLMLIAITDFIRKNSVKADGVMSSDFTAYYNSLVIGRIVKAAMDVRYAEYWTNMAGVNKVLVFEDFQLFCKSIDPFLRLDQGKELSMEYIKSFYYMSLNQLWFKKMTCVSFSEFYELLKARTSFITRDKMLTYLFKFSNKDVLFQACGISYTEYSEALRETLGYVNSDVCKKMLTKLSSSVAQGATPFSGSLLQDTSGKKLSITDFKGKVVLVDIWGDNCSGCSNFAKSFHKNIYSSIKNRQDFVVVSIMNENRITMDRYKDLITNKGSMVYTYPDYVNLYAGKEETNSKEFNEYYDYYGVPFVMLYDKEGKLVSSTLPLAFDDVSPNVQRLKSIIEEQLNRN